MDLTKIIMTIVIVGGLVSIVQAVNKDGGPLKRVERNECETWKKQEQEFKNNPAWYTTDWQKEQCQQFGISFER